MNRIQVLIGICWLICSACEPHDAIYYYHVGVRKDSLKDYKGAIANFTKAIELNHAYGEAYNDRGISKDKLHDYHGAIADYNKAIEINPNYEDAYNNRGLAKRKFTRLLRGNGRL